MKLFASLTIAVSVFVSLTPSSQAAPIVLNQNGIINPGAEQGGLGSSTGNDVIALPGWIITGNFTSVQYGAAATGLISGGAAFGSNFFAGGPNTPTDQATQTIDVSNLGAAIDGGQVAYTLSGFFGGYLAQNDNATLFATFFTAANTVIANSAVVGGFNSTGRSNLTQLLFDSRSGFIPGGTRSVLITLQMTRVEGFYNDGYADNLSFVARSVGLVPLPPTPEPATWVLLGLGSCMMIARRAFNR